MMRFRRIGPQTVQTLRLSIISLLRPVARPLTRTTAVRGWLRLIFVVTVCVALSDSFSVPLAAPPDGRPDEGEQPQSAPAQEEGWSLHFQSTGIYQGYLPFSAPYSGANSLSRKGQIRETVTVTGFFGRRLWPGAEVYLNPDGF